MSVAIDLNISSMRDLVDAIDAFLSTEGWTQDSAPTGTTTGNASWSIGDCYVQVEWSAEDELTIHQSTGYAAAGPGSETGDSQFPSSLDTFSIPITNGSLWSFGPGSGTTDTEQYAHFALEFNSDGRFAHFGFGHANPDNSGYGTLAYKYGWQWSATATPAQEPWNANHRVLLDSNHNGTSPATNLATIRATGLPDQKASGKWLAFTSSDGNITTTDIDGAGLDKALGWARHGIGPYALLWLRGNPNDAHIPLIPVEILYKAEAADTIRRPLGRMRDVFVCNIGNIQPREVLNLGGTNYRFFPWGQKLTNPGSGIIGSRNAGIAYTVIT